MGRPRKWMALKRGPYTRPLEQCYALKSREAWRFAEQLLGVTLSEATSSADLGSSSKYSSENLEDRSGERFRVNSIWTRVSRS